MDINISSNQFWYMQEFKGKKNSIVQNNNYSFSKNALFLIAP